MTTPHLDSKPEVASETATQTQPASQSSPSTQSTQSTPAVDYVIPEARVDNDPTAAERLSAWWNHTVPRGARTVFTQLVIALVVVLLVLPIASTLGWFGLRTAAPGSASAGASMAGMSSQTTTATKPNPNAPAHQLYDPQAPATPQGDVVNVQLTAKDTLLSIAPGVAYQAWTFNGTVPGPVIRVRQGQTVHFTLTNDTNMSHSIDFHAAQTPWSVNYQPVAPGKSFSFDWKANYPGVFLYHCGTPPVMVHMANGMYGAIIVDPANGWATPAQEFVLVQSEFFTQQNADGTYSLSTTKMMNNAPDYVVFNGYADQYTQSPLTVKAGERIRLFVVNAGPSHFSAFHVIGAIFSDTYADGNPANHLQGNQTVTIPPGGGEMVELTIPEAGSYLVLTHSFMDATIGALGMIKATP